MKLVEIILLSGFRSLAFYRILYMTQPKPLRASHIKCNLVQMANRAYRREVNDEIVIGHENSGDVADSFGDAERESC